MEPNFDVMSSNSPVSFPYVNAAWLKKHPSYAPITPITNHPPITNGRNTAPITERTDIAYAELHRLYHELIITEGFACKAMCTNLMELFTVEDLETKALQTMGGASKATVGLMLDGCAIDNLLIGGPGHNCGALKKGDIIVAVDNQPVDSDNVLDSIVGSDTPGSSVILTLKKIDYDNDFSLPDFYSDQFFSVELVRMATAEIAERRRLFELFTALKAKAKLNTDQHEQWSPDPTSGNQGPLMAAERIIGGLTLGSFGKESHVDSTSEREQRRQIADMSKGYGQLVDETVALWSKMVFEDSHAKERAFKKVKNMQTNGLKILKALGAKLDCLGQCGLTLKDKAVEIEEFWQKQLGAKQEQLENLLAEKQEWENQLAEKQEWQNQLTERQRKRIEELENQKFHDQLTENQRKRIEELENQLADYHDQLTEKQRKRIEELERERQIVLDFQTDQLADYHAQNKLLNTMLKNRVIAQAWNSWKSNQVEQNRLRSILGKVARHWTNRVIAQAWNSWKSNHVEQKRLRSVLSKVARRWTNRVIAKGWNSWKSNHVEQKRLRSVLSKVARRWKNREIAQAWNTWNTWKSNLLEQKRLRCILSNIARHWKNRVIAQAWNSWYAGLVEQKWSRDQAQLNELTSRLKQANDELIAKEETMNRCQELESSLVVDYAEHSQLKMRLQSALEEVYAKEETTKQVGDRCQELERCLEYQERSIFKLKANYEELESLQRERQAQKDYAEEYREQLARVGELEALLGEAQTERAAEVAKLRDVIRQFDLQLDEMRKTQSQVKVEPREEETRVGELEALLRKGASEVENLRDEITKLTWQLDGMRTMQSQRKVVPEAPARAAEVQKLRDEVMRVTGMMDGMRTMQSQLKVEPQAPATTQLPRVQVVVPGDGFVQSRLLQTAMADASSGFRLIEGRNPTREDIRVRQPSPPPMHPNLQSRMYSNHMA